MKPVIGNESVSLAEYVSLLTTQSVTVNLVKVGLILLKSHPFLGASFDHIITNVSNLETCRVEIRCPSSKLYHSISYVLKDKKYYLEK